MTRARRTNGGVSGRLTSVSEALRVRLADPDRRVRLAAVAELSERHDAEAAELLDAALDDEHRLVRFRAVEALGRVGDPLALELLLARMDDDAQPTLLRRFAVDAVVAIGTPEAADALEARMQTYSSRRGRRIVAKKIAKMRAAHGA
jgi:HEAT repeat protein